METFEFEPKWIWIHDRDVILWWDTNRQTYFKRLDMDLTWAFHPPSTWEPSQL